jgi:trans-aconitate methyltransferase
VSPRQIEIARARVPEARFEIADILDLEPGEHCVDGVVSFYAIFHVPRDGHAELLQTLASYLNPGGAMLLTMGASEHEGWESDFHGVEMYWSHFGPTENRRLVEATGMTVLDDHVDTANKERHQVILATRRGNG